MQSHRRLIRSVSFSGIDGAGKSTQIDALRQAVEQAGICVRTIRFWDDVAVLTGLRETSGHRIFKGDKGIGSPSNPINRRDKNVRSWKMTCVRLFLYTVDAISARLTAARLARSCADLVIFDRYIYDELANLNLDNALMRAYVRLIAWFVPRPGVSYVLDADPAQARARKPEYPLEFIFENRRAYLELSRLIGGIAVIPPGSIAEVRRNVLRHAFHAVFPAQGESREPEPEYPVERAALR